MKKIDLSNYEIDSRNEEGKKVKVPYSVKGSLLIILFHPELKLSSRELYENNKVAAKIEECEDDSLLLEDSEYGIVKKAIETIRGYNRNDVELINRVLNAETVTVKEK